MIELSQDIEDKEKKLPIWQYILAIIGGIIVFLGSVISGNFFKPSPSTKKKYLGFIAFMAIILLLYLWIRY